MSPHDHECNEIGDMITNQPNPQPPAPVEGEWSFNDPLKNDLKIWNTGIFPENPKAHVEILGESKEAVEQLATQIVESVNRLPLFKKLTVDQYNELEDLRAENQKLREENKSLRDTISDWHSH